MLRIPIGMALALLIYFAIRGGLLTASALSSSDINPFGLAAVAGLVGLSSRQATEKLAEVFRTLFPTAPAPGGSGPSGPATTATLGGKPRKVVFKDSEHVAVEVDVADAKPGTLTLAIANPGTDAALFDVVVNA